MASIQSWILGGGFQTFMFCSCNFIIEITWNSVFSSKPVCSGTNSLSVWVKTCCSECLNMRDDFYGFIFILESTIWSSWKIEQQNKQILILRNVYASYFQNDLELFKCGISPLIFAASLPIFGERRCPHPRLPNGLKDVAAKQCKGKITCHVSRLRSYFFLN